MRKVCIVIASRANWGRLQAVCKAISEHPQLKLQVIVAATALNLKLDHEPDAIIQCQVDGDNLQSMTLTTGLFLTQLGGVLERLKPDIVLVHGDRFEVLGAAIAAAYLGIPLAHTEGGDVSGTIDEKVRHAITKLADIHFPISELSARRVIQMGEYPDMVFNVGSTALDNLVGIDLTNNRKEPYILILHHPNVTKNEDASQLFKAVGMLDIHKLWIAPNVDPGSKAMLKVIHRQDVEFIKNLPPEKYARLLYNCQCAIGNSSSFIKEGAFLGVPTVLVGARQEGREHGDNVTFADYDTKAILEAVRAQMGKKYPQDYRFGDGTASKKIADILATVKVREKKLCIPL